METFVVTALWLLAVLLVVQGALVIGFVVALLRHSRSMLPDDQCPRAAVVLCLRGTDPFLRRCLEAITVQDYPRFVVRVIVDDRADPAWSVVEQVILGNANSPLVLEPLQVRRETCSLKCSSVVQAIEALDESVEFVAQLDADTIPHRTWLRELATALSDERVGAATGNRWYMPEDNSWGALVRYLWNAAAVVQMYWYRIPWGGTLAIKTQVIRQVGLLERWSHAFCEDTMLLTQLRRHGWRVRFVPSLIMVNRESCDLGGFTSWMRRQLLTARLYHPGWPAVVAHGIGISAVLGASCLLVIVAAVWRDTDAVVWMAAAMSAYQLGVIVLLAPIEWAVRRIVAKRGEPHAWLTMGKFARMLAAILLTQVVYPLTLVSTILLRRVDWRRATYQIDGPWKIKLLSQTPYGNAESDAESQASL